MISVAGKKRIAAAQRARWAKIKNQRSDKETVAHNDYMKKALAQIDAGIAKKQRELKHIVELRKVVEKLSKIAA
jgi:hypothetical protein